MLWCRRLSKIGIISFHFKSDWQILQNLSVSWWYILPHAFIMKQIFYKDLSLYLCPDISLSVMYWIILRNAFLKTLNYHQRNVFVQHYKTSLTHHHFSQLYPSGRFFQVWSDLLGKKITSMTSAVKKYYLSNKLTLLQFFKLTFLLHRHGICSGPAVISSHNEALEVTTSQSSVKFSEDKSRHGAE